MAVPPDLLHLDLCILAYQLYHQSLVWPLDPWYEFLATPLFADRRSLFMKAVHAFANDNGPGDDLYAGPAVLRGLGTSNQTLDPILTQYERIRPRAPAFSRDDMNFVAMQAPAYVTDPIKAVSVCHYTEAASFDRAAQAKVRRLFDYEQGSDHVIAFEGVTGSRGTTTGAYSLMGCVLKRIRTGQGGGHDVHIVFRGSRSGSAMRAALQANSGFGNPDWVSDMDAELVSAPRVSRSGLVSRGFSNAMRGCLGTITAALLEVDKTYGPPREITVSGHSLGAACAALFASAVAIGSFGDEIRRTLPAWPWDRLRGFFFAEPPVGDKTFADAFNSRLACHAPYVVGDGAVECSGAVNKATTAPGKILSLIAGKGHQAGTLVFMERPGSAAACDDSHEMYVIRLALAAKHKGNFDALTVSNLTPWAMFKSFTDLVTGNAFTCKGSGPSPRIVHAGNLKSVLKAYNFTGELEAFFALFRGVVVNPGAYRTPKLFQRKANRQLDQQKLDVAASMLGQNLGTDQAKVIDALVTQVLALADCQDARVDRYLGLGVILAAIEGAPFDLRLEDLRKEPELEACLDATWQ